MSLGEKSEADPELRDRDAHFNFMIRWDLVRTLTWQQRAWPTRESSEDVKGTLTDHENGMHREVDMRPLQKKSGGSACLIAGVAKKGTLIKSAAWSEYPNCLHHENADDVLKIGTFAPELFYKLFHQECTQQAGRCNKKPYRKDDVIDLDSGFPGLFQFCLYSLPLRGISAARPPVFGMPACLCWQSTFGAALGPT